MISKTLIIYEYQILYKILSEIKEYLNFEILDVDKNKFQELEFDKLIDILDLSDSETQFLLFLEWSALNNALDQYLGRLLPKNDDRYQIATIAYELDHIEIRQMVLAPSEMPKVIPCRKR